MTLMRRLGGSLLIVTLALVTLTAQSSSNGSRGAKPYTTWTAYQGGAHSSQYSALDQINKSNVSQLEVAWTYPVAGNITFNPIVVDNVMYVQGTGNAIVALDAATGKELWSHANQGAIGARGINYWESADRKDRRLVYLNAGNLTAINAQTGDTITTFGKNGRVDLRDRAVARSAEPAADQQPRTDFREPHHHLAAGAGRWLRCDARRRAGLRRASPASSPGCSTAFRSRASSATTRGRRARIRRPAACTTGASSRSTRQNGIAFIPFGTARFDFYGGDRDGNNLFANSLVALDARTGKRLWHYQLVHHDLWDYDLPQAPKLLTLQQNGRNIDVVAQATKHGFLYVFERKTGKPMWPIEERPVPQVRRARRVVVADAAVPDEAGAVRAAVVHREGHQSVSARGGAGAAPRAAEERPQRRAVHAAEPRRLDQAARSQRRRELGQHCGRSDQGRALRRGEEHADVDAAGAEQRRADARAVRSVAADRARSPPRRRRRS